MQEAFKEVMEREKLDVAAQPHVHDLKFEEGQPLTFELHLEVRPESSSRARRASRSRARERAGHRREVREQIEQIRDQQATWAPVEEQPRRATW